jgi:hypothetical protein
MYVGCWDKDVIKQIILHPHIPQTLAKKWPTSWEGHPPPPLVSYSYNAVVCPPHIVQRMEMGLGNIQGHSTTKMLSFFVFVLLHKWKNGKMFQNMYDIKNILSSCWYDACQPSNWSTLAQKSHNSVVCFKHIFVFYSCPSYFHWFSIENCWTVVYYIMSRNLSKKY